MKRFKRAVEVLGLAAIITVFLPTAFASAHRGSITAECYNGVPKAVVNLRDYNGTNQIALKNNNVDFGPSTFGKELKDTYDLGDPTIQHTVIYRVLAWDDLQEQHGWSFHGTIVVPACQQPAPTTTAVPETTTTVAETTTTVIVPETTTTVSGIDVPEFPVIVSTAPPPVVTAVPVVLPATGTSTVGLIVVGWVAILLGLLFIRAVRRPSDVK